MSQPLEFDAAILGGGSAGYAAARTLAAGGRRTAVVEGAEEVGGLCILRGCMPTKALLRAAEVKHLAEKSATWGLRPKPLGFHFPAVMARKDAMIADFAGYRRKQLGDGRFEFLRSTARFIDPHTVVLADGRTLRAGHFVIATGSVVAEPPLPALDDAGFLTSDDCVRLEKLPRSLVILGGGAIACEFAQFFARFGVAVTLVQRSPRLLRDFDEDAARVVEAVFRREGVRVFTGTKLLDARRTGAGRAVVFGHEGKTQTVEAEEILHALGRTPNTRGLNLPAAGVATDGDRIVTDAAQRTSAPHIFAAGDCCGPHEIVHLAIQQGEVAARNILGAGAPRAMDYRLLTSVVFTEPQVAAVGLTEAAARAQGVPFVAASHSFSDHGKSMIMDALDGYVKLLAEPRTGEILGGACVGPLGGELIHEVTVAMAARMTVRQFAAVPHYHPTLAEIWTYPAEELAEQVSAK
jgi:pyruvate/2-oxoglutarate dehydrogenase complex dihydrolipoamide dehydrogenase (E3) component